MLRRDLLLKIREGPKGRARQFGERTFVKEGVVAADQGANLLAGQRAVLHAGKAHAAAGRIAEDVSAPVGIDLEAVHRRKKHVARP